MSRVTIFIRGTSSELNCLSCKRSIYYLMPHLHDGTFWHLHSGWFEIEHFCFCLDYFIFPCNSIALHLAVYFGKVEGPSEMEFFLITTIKNLERSISIMCE